MKDAALIPPTSRTLAIIMGGGAGTRLFPLTKERAKPAVPLGGKYRLVDIPISNCLSSDIRGIYVLTQFNSMSLHRHINASYKFDHFNDSFVEILAAQQTPEGSKWYQGTADAVRQNLRYFLERPCDYFVILSGDQLYRMDYRKVLQEHLQSGSDLTIATIPVQREAAKGFGIMHTDREGRIVRFEEKPQADDLLDSLRMPDEMLEGIGKAKDEELFLASMGIYLFNREVLEAALENDCDDFGRDIIPQAISRFKVSAHVFQGYWEDIGTIRSFYNANLSLTAPKPPYSFYAAGFPVYTHPRFLPASVVRKAEIDRAVISDGCIIEEATLECCVVGIRSVIERGSTLRNSIIMGADFYEADLDSPPKGVPHIGIGHDCLIDNAIIDKNARVGNRVVITPQGKSRNFDGEGFYIREGIVIIPKNSVIPDGTWI